MENRKGSFDIVLWGATGFTGSLIAEYLAKKAPKTLKWAIAGRNLAKLIEIKKNILTIDPFWKEVGILVGDSSDQISVDNVVKQTKVLLSASGPYIKYGIPIVDACVRLGVDYCDLAGELHFISQSIEKYNDLAVKNNVRIVHSCGYDSIPCDLGVFMVVDYMKKQYNIEPDVVKTFYGKTRGGPSGGTFHSFMSYLDVPKSKAISQMKNPYYLNPPESTPGNDKSDLIIYPTHDNDARGWTAYNIMTSINAKVVRRSKYLCGYSFQYSERFQCSSLWSACTWSLLIMLLGWIVTFAPRWILYKIGPKPGEGPSKKTRDNGEFNVIVIGKSKDKVVIGKVGDKCDPGYSSTSKMIAQSALCLALDRNSMPGLKGGVLTPSAAMGSALLKRLRETDMKWTVETKN